MHFDFFRYADQHGFVSLGRGAGDNCQSFLSNITVMNRKTSIGPDALAGVGVELKIHAF
jgi:hypothetical protein